MRPNPLELLATITAAGAVAVALVGTVVPAFPGLVVAWVALLVYGAIVGYDTTGIIIMSAVTLLTLGAYILMIRIPQKQVEKRGASRMSTLFGGLGAIVGFFAIPVVGFIVGGIAGVFGAEFYRTRNRSLAWTSTKGVLVGFGLSTLVQLAFGLVIGALFVTWVVLRFDL